MATKMQVCKASNSEEQLFAALMAMNVTGAT